LLHTIFKYGGNKDSVLYCIVATTRRPVTLGTTAATTCTPTLVQLYLYYYCDSFCFM